MADLKMATVMSLSGRIGLITGGGTGIGFSIAKAVRCERSQGSVVPLQMDVTSENSVKAGAQHIEGIDGKLDILVNNAGFAASLRDPDFIAKQHAAEDPFEPETVQNWADIFALNTIAPFFVERIPALKAPSSVINISSVAAKLNTPGSFVSLAYGPTKAALSKLTLVLGTNFAQRDIPIRVNALAPGVFASQLVGPNLLEAIRTRPLPGMVAPIPAKRQGTEAEIGMSAVYLAVSDYTNGAILTVDGGISLVNP
ncbi:short-chain dehydrogenase [Desarmillaria tabescens]|uniref:Short-chain dehydrogenase n=1 Tax=Armillaria tabescens TaxID=1929756 RepID=A0AA39JGA1_ARMTA|nr:short-chain dehydrogenase [Desarmillaria tabescens]KAK0442237.1 short-chain dehydrogenase [Desarmillaria tabescens]